MAEDSYVYAPDMQAAVNNNGGMHFAYYVGSYPAGTVCEVAELSNLKGNEPFAYTSDPKQVTCAMCKGVMKNG